MVAVPETATLLLGIVQKVRQEIRGDLRLTCSDLDLQLPESSREEIALDRIACELQGPTICIRGFFLLAQSPKKLSSRRMEVHIGIH